MESEEPLLLRNSASSS